MTNQQIAIVTGVSGQMGSYFAEFLLAKGFKVIGTIRRLSVKNHRNIEHITDPNFVLAPMDLGDSHSINSLISLYKPGYFVNCAANSFVGSSWDFPEQHFEYNTLGVLRQLEAIKRFSPRTRYVNFGSSEEFGDVQYSPQDDKHPARARSPYGASKIAARQIVKVYRESFGMYAIQCWCFNYESPRRGEEFVSRKVTKGVARIARAIKDGKPFDPIQLGTLDSKRDWSHALDYVDGIWRLLNQEVYNPAIAKLAQDEWVSTYAVGEADVLPILSKHIKEYVFASGQTQTVRDLATRAFAAAGFIGVWKGEGVNESFTSEGISLIEVNPAFYRPCEVDLLWGDATPASVELGWSPKVSFPDLVIEMVKSDLAAVGL